MQGFIKIHRELTEWEWYDDAYMVKILLHFIFKANYENKKWKGIAVNKGQFISGIYSLSEELNMTPRKIRTCIDRLVECGEIDKQTTNRFTLFTLIKWDKFQIENEKTTNKRQAKDKPKTTTKEGKEGKKGIDEVSIPIGWQKDFDDFIEMRKKIKKPMTERAKELLINKLHKLEKAGNDAPLVLQQSILNDWSSVYELKENKNGNQQRSSYDIAAERIIAARNQGTEQ